MKKLLFLLACTAFVLSPRAEAKSVKLGRTTGISSGNKATLVAQSDKASSTSCTVGYYRSGKSCKLCSSNDSMGEGCAECTNAPVCTKCKKGYDMYDGHCRRPDDGCSGDTFFLNADSTSENPIYIGAECKNVDVYGANAYFYTPDNRTDYNSFNVRYWNSATIDTKKNDKTKGGIKVRTLKSTYNTSYNIDDLKNSVITFNEPVTVTGSVILQEALTDIGGVTMNFPQGLSGNPACVVDKRIPSSGCGYSNCSESVETNTTCSCTTSQCKIDLPAEVMAQDCSTTFFWNSNGAITVPEGYNCVDGYGATSSVTMPATTNYHRVNVRFWNGANVMNAFSTTELASRDHTSSHAASLNTSVHFKGHVRADRVVLEEATNSMPGHRMGVTMFFDAGLEALTGNTVSCSVVKMEDAPGTCQWSSCNRIIATDAVCSCNNAKCEIADNPETSYPLSCGEGNYFINMDGIYSIPSGKTCVDAYGQSATISMPSGTPVYNTVNIRMWDGATVKNAFKTQTLKSLHNTSWNSANLNATITFTDPVTVDGSVILQEATNSTAGDRKGMKMVFSGGLTGNPTCTVKKEMESSGCGYASCSAQIETSATCTCTDNVCQINNDAGTTCQSGYAWREQRTGSGAWAAGCYPIGDCETSRPDLVAGNMKPTCMFVNASTHKGQCKTDNVWTSTECTVN